MRKIEYFELGGTLYIPIIHKNLLNIVNREKYSFLKSIVICLEDAILDEEVKKGIEILKYLQFQKSDLKVFIRPRNEKMLSNILTFKNIELFDGFVLPKIDDKNIDNYIHILKDSKFYVMPTIENILNDNILFLLKEKFKMLNILTIRIGIEDILGSFSIIRKDEIYFNNFLIMGFIYKIFSIFKDKYYVSAPVCPFIKNDNILINEVEKEKNFNILNKTIIHPNQAIILNEEYKVTKKEKEIALKLLKKKEAIFREDDRMYEFATHKNWAKIILKREKFYGVKDE